MKKQLTLIVTLLLLALIGSSQPGLDKLSFFSSSTAGVAIGKSRQGFIAQTVNGVRKNNWSLGAGLGVNEYYYKSYPLFGDIRVYAGKQKRLYAFGNLGYNFSGKNVPGNDIYNVAEYDFHGGVYTGLGIGTSFKMSGKIHIAFEGGFAYKEMGTKIRRVSPCLIAPCPIDYSTYAYKLGTVILRAGILF